MRLSTKSRYGLRALFDIAYNAGGQPAQIQDISRRQDISPRYLEQIFQGLKKNGILKSKRGPQGGYCLAKSPEEITVRAVIEATEGDTWTNVYGDVFKVTDSEIIHVERIEPPKRYW